MIKHFSKLTIGLMAMALAACSNVDEPEVNAPSTGTDAATEATKDVYATLTLKLPSSTGSRANNGEEFGQDFENNVGKILVVLATKDGDSTYKYLTRATADAKPNFTDVAYNTVKYVLNFSSSEMTPNPLDKTENSNGATIPGTTVYVFAYCNPTTELTNFFNLKSKGDIFTDELGKITDKDNAEIWSENRFLMTNCEISATGVEIPARDVLVNQHNTPEKAFQLGTVKVKRVAARFDFKTTNDNKYDINDIDGVTKVGTVELTEMAMFNISQHYHYLPRTNSNWDWTGTTTLCGDLEGYVMSCNTNNFKAASSLSASYRGHYFCNLVGNTLTGSNSSATDDLTWVSIKPDAWNNRTEDNNNTTGEGNDATMDWTPDAGGYRIWRYTTENTIPGGANGATATQKVGITTGVVFKGEFDPVNKERWNGNAVYVHNNIVYGDFAALKAYVEKNPETIVADDFKKVNAFQNVSEDADLSKSLLTGVAESGRNGFKAYEADADKKYTMYYFYYNRHSSNGNNSLMGENEFGVVRNNVYKLAVTTCGRFGEPESTTKPDDPDEEENAYFTVSCVVMPWTVRVNNIEF